MHKDQKEELERLEAALMEMDQPEEPEEEDMDQWLEDLFADEEDDCVESYDVYNTDDTDVELEEYSQDVHEGRRGGGCLIPILLFLTLVLCALVGFMLWKMGVIG